MFPVKMLWLSTETHHMSTTWSCEEAKHDCTVVLVRKKKGNTAKKRKVSMWPLFHICICNHSLHTVCPHTAMFFFSFLKELMSILIGEMYFLSPKNGSYISPTNISLSFIYISFTHSLCKKCLTMHSEITQSTTIEIVSLRASFLNVLYLKNVV